MEALMGMNLSSLLLLLPDVPGSAKQLLLDATRAPPAEQDRKFLEAARELAMTTELDCGEALDLVGLHSAA